MKFLNKDKIHFKSIFKSYEVLFLNDFNFDYFFYDYDKYFIKNRKIMSLTKKGVTKNIKNNSKKLVKNFSPIHNYIKLNIKKGNIFLIYNSLNKLILNFNIIFNNDLHEFKNYENYDFINNILKLDFNNLDMNFFIKIFLSDLESVFDIKSKKNNKKDKKKLGRDNKYSYEIVYIKKEKRLKNVLRSLSFFKNSFKKNKIDERIFWSFFISFLNKKNSFLQKKKLFIYAKSIKFFKKSKK